MMTIYFIYADNCPDCRDMLNTIERAMAMSHADGNIEIKEIESESEDAVNIALEQGIDDIPGCAIGRKTFSGKDSYTYDALLEAIEETWKENTQNKQIKS